MFLLIRFTVWGVLLSLMVHTTMHTLWAKSKYKVVAVKSGGSIKGRVTFKGKIPKPRNKPVNKDKEVCGEGKRTFNKVTLGNAGGLSGAVVYIEKIVQGKDWSDDLKKEIFVLEQEKCTFNPKSFIVRRNAKLQIFNKDPVAHNIHSYEIAGRARITMFNSGQPANSNFTKSLRLRRPTSHAMKLECDAHNFMHEWMFIADTPYYTLTSKDGKYSMTGIPPGKYKIVAWHRALGTKKSSATVTAGKAVTLGFTFKK